MKSHIGSCAETLRVVNYTVCGREQKQRNQSFKREKREGERHSRINLLII
jgi:hypothetical protein